MHMLAETLLAALLAGLLWKPVAALYLIWFVDHPHRVGYGKGELSRWWTHIQGAVLPTKHTKDES